ncbi:MAG: diguanylate cyclase [Oscillochloridaceae bacterium umkhey_bin13]
MKPSPPPVQIQPRSLAERLRPTTIRSRLLRAFMLLVLLPATLISFSAVYLGLRNGQQQVINQLQSVATLKEEQIDAWLDSLRIHLGAAIYSYQVPTLVEPLLTQPADSPAYQQARTALGLHFDQLVETTGLFEEIWLLDRQGVTRLSTNPAREGQVHSTQEYFWRGIQGPYTQSLAATTSQGLSSPVIVSRPINDATGQPLAVLVGRASSRTLNAIMTQWAGLGATGETYLVGANTLLLTQPRFARPDQPIRRLQTPILTQVIQERQNHAGLYQNYHNDAVIGVYHWLPDLQLVLVAEQAQAEAFQPTYANLTVNLVVAAMTVVIALILARFVARGIATPLASLAETATQIAAGNLNLRAQLQRHDEVGALALAFNRMTDRLRLVIGNLQRHVAEIEQAEAEVRRVNAQLARDIHEQETLNQLSQQLQRSQSLHDAYLLSLPLLERLFPDTSGALFRRVPLRPQLELVGAWGSEPAIVSTPEQMVCPALQFEPALDNTHLSIPVRASIAGQPLSNHAGISQCAHCAATGHYNLLCVQLQAGGEVLGLLQIQAVVTLDHAAESSDGECGAAKTTAQVSANPNLTPLVIRVADLLALALSNLQLRENLREQAIRDPLTGLFNRRFANEILGPRLAEAERRQTQLGLVLLDLDYFKQINDTYGHDAGDATLRAVGATLNRYTRTDDVACRFGGEEVLVIMSQISVEQAVERANQLRTHLRVLVIEHQGRTLPPLTASIGIALYPEHGQTHTELLIAADHALYQAKSSGRDRVCVAERVLHNEPMP